MNLSSNVEFKEFKEKKYQFKRSKKGYPVIGINNKNNPTKIVVKDLIVLNENFKDDVYSFKSKNKNIYFINENYILIKIYKETNKVGFTISRVKDFSCTSNNCIYEVLLRKYPDSDMIYINKAYKDMKDKLLEIYNKYCIK